MDILLLALSALASLSLLVNYRLFGVLLGASKSNRLLLTENQQLAESLFDSYQEDGRRPRHRWKKESQTVQTLSLVRRQEDVLVTEICQQCRIVHRYWKHGIANHDPEYKVVEGFFIGGSRVDNSDQTKFCYADEQQKLLPASDEE